MEDYELSEFTYEVRSQNVYKITFMILLCLLIILYILTKCRIIQRIRGSVNPVENRDVSIR